MFQEKEKLKINIKKNKKLNKKMIKKEQLYLLLQIIRGMNDAVDKLEKAHKNKDIENFERARKSVLEFQRNLDKELEEVK